MTKEAPLHNTTLPFPFPCQLSGWAVAPGSKVRKGTLLCSCVQSVKSGEREEGEEGGGKEETRLHVKSGVVGVVQELMYSVGDIIQPG